MKTALLLVDMQNDGCGASTKNFDLLSFCHPGIGVIQHPGTSMDMSIIPLCSCLYGNNDNFLTYVYTLLCAYLDTAKQREIL